MTLGPDPTIECPLVVAKVYSVVTRPKAGHPGWNARNVAAPTAPRQPAAARWKGPTFRKRKVGHPAGHHQSLLAPAEVRPPAPNDAQRRDR